MNKTIWLFFLLLVNVPSFAQVKIAAIRKHYRAFLSDHSFPLISATNKDVADNINHYLQSELLFNETVQTNADKIFANAIHVDEEDSTRLSGLASIEYEVVLNNKYLLSLSFIMETEAAYPSTHYRYFSFNLETGKPISTKEIFTREGISWLKKHLVAERAARLAKHVSAWEIDPEDSTSVRESLVECNAESDEEMMFVKAGTMLFYKYGCLPHVIQAYDMEWDVEMDLKQLKAYFTPFARKIFRIKKEPVSHTGPSL